MVANKANAYVGAFLDGEYEASLSALEDVLKGSPKDAQALLYKSYNLGALWKIREALEALGEIDEPGVWAQEIGKIRSVYEFFITNERQETPSKTKSKRLPPIRGESSIQGKKRVAKPASPTLGIMESAVRRTDEERQIIPQSVSADSAESILESSGLVSEKTLEFSRSVGPLNEHDVRHLRKLVLEKDQSDIETFLRVLSDRKRILEALSDSNAVSPRTHQTIVAKIAETHAEFGLAWIECNIGHQKFESLLRNAKPTIAKISDGGTWEWGAETGAKFWNAKYVLTFVNRMFEHASLLRDDRSRLAYFKMAFLFFAFLATLAFFSDKFGGPETKIDAVSSRAGVESGVDCEIGNALGKLSKNANGRYVCKVTSCSPWYHMVDEECEKDSRTCEIANGIGTQDWAGSSWKACVATSCEAGYALRDGACLSVFPGCEAPDIRIGKTVWAACDAERRALFTVNGRSYYDADNALEACGEDYRLPTESDYRAAWTAMSSGSQEANALIKALGLDLNGTGKFDRTVELAGKIGRYATSTKMTVSPTDTQALSAFSFAAGIPERGARFTYVPLETPISVRCVRR